MDGGGGVSHRQEAPSSGNIAHSHTSRTQKESGLRRSLLPAWAPALAAENRADFGCLALRQVPTCSLRMELNVGLAVSAPGAAELDASCLRLDPEIRADPLKRNARAVCLLRLALGRDLRAFPSNLRLGHCCL